MRKYTVVIRETLLKEVTVEAEDAEVAQEKVEQAWESGEHILDAGHFRGVEFSVRKRMERDR